MNLRIETIYENGVFRPIQPIKGIVDKTKVPITIDPSFIENHPLKSVIGIMPDEDAQEMLKIIKEEFGKENPNEW